MQFAQENGERHFVHRSSQRTAFFQMSGSGPALFEQNQIKQQASTLLQYTFTFPHSLEMCNLVTKKKCLHKVHTNIHTYFLYVHPINSTGSFRFILHEVTKLYKLSILEGHGTVQLVSSSHTMYVRISLTTASTKLQRVCMFRIFHQYRERINSLFRNNILYMPVKYT